MRKTLFLGFLLVGGIIFAQQTCAQVSIGISPLVFELTGNPGDVIENQVKIYNPSDNPIGIKMTTEDIAPSGEEGHVIVEAAETETYSLASWVAVDPGEFTLNPKEEKWVKFTITIPANAEPGGHYGTVIAGPHIVSGLEMTGAAISIRVGTLVLLTVPGVAQEILAVKDFSAPRYSEYGPVTFDILFENSGTVHVKPTGLITVANWFGKKVDVIPFPERNVLPGGLRRIEVIWNQKWLWGGKYTATITGNYGIGNSQIVPVVITFWAFPWKFGLVIFLVIILLILARKRLFAAFRILLRGER
ncbi:MAG: DUF916 domain-containing protein [Patescibacteria group bacterium]